MNAKRQPYEIVEVALSHSQSVRRYSNTKKLPAIEHEGKFVSDSTDIAYYLEKTFPDRPLIPSDDKLWAKCHLYEDWADESLNFYMMKLRWLPQNRRRWAKALAKEDSGIRRWLVDRLVAAATLNILDKQGIGRKSESQIVCDLNRHLKALSIDLRDGEFLLGDDLSLADISVYVQLYWMAENPEGRAIVEQYSSVVQWMGRVDTATQRVV